MPKMVKKSVESGNIQPGVMRAPKFNPKGGMNLIIDGHAHAGGEYYDYGSIIRVLDENKADRVVLCPGEVNSMKYRRPS